MAGDLQHGRARLVPQRRLSAAVRRRRVAALLLAAGIAAFAGVSFGARDPEMADRVLVLAAGRPVLSLPVSDRSPRRVRALLSRRLSGLAAVRRGRARLVIRYDVDATVRRVLEQRAAGRIAATERVVEAEIGAPVVKQAQRNTCESAALEILLATAGRRIAQGALQAALPRSGPIDPQGLGTPEMVWGDPDVGYVGRPDGGGVAGGFGVYQGPVRRVAARFGVPLVDLTGASAAEVYDVLRSGRAVMAWIGLSDGPYGSWSTPEGGRVNVNFGEHTVVLHGIDADGRLSVLNPLEGTRERWTAAEFELLWRRLGRRAVTTRPATQAGRASQSYAT